ncbi:DUF4062 domain-containing protein [Phenylobacterium sp.]|uniref:DUF4062 domain-containing protein n=1 Tax=Phenylobacterium sp. TaxID=1871053 RepID=UPI00271B45E4|nr:DUF4062 domain-containing protein [Phenylobacterium sp.]MDO8379603.1 DUF4062 domain-containing protein [Phenylobacterium sp.]
MDVRYQFFISSTFEDLREERQQVIQAVLELGHIPVGMEIFPSAEEAPWDVIRQTIKDSDYYIVLSAGRYGNVFPDGVSFTEREFDLASELKIPITGFIHATPLDLPKAKREDEPQQRRRLSSFHDKIRHRYVRTWSTTEDLGLQASKAIIHATRNHPRTGWVRADQARSTADLARIEELRAEIDELNKKLEDANSEQQQLQDLIRSTVLAEEDISPDLLAQGSDEITFPISYTLDGKKYREDIRFTWDECIAAIGPDLYGRMHWRDFQGRYAFESSLNPLLRRHFSGPQEAKTLRYDRGDIERLMFQFKQLGIIMIGTADNGSTGWTLTPGGEAHVTKLLVRLKEPGKGRKARSKTTSE